MNLRLIAIVSAILSLSLVTVVFAVDVTSRIPSSQTSAVDIQVLNITPNGGIYSQANNGVLIAGDITPTYNFTSAFAFQQPSGLVSIDSVTVTLTYSAGFGALPSAADLQLNGGATISFATKPLSTAIASTVGNLPAANLNVGTNSIKIFIPPLQPSTAGFFLFNVHVAVQYTHT